MSYASSEEALYDILNAITGLKGNVASGTHSLANKGREVWARLDYSSFTQQRETYNSYVSIVWEVTIRIFTRYKDDVQVRTDQDTWRQTVINSINAHTSLANTVFDAFITRGEKGDENITIGQVRYFEDILFCSISEDQEVTRED